MATHALRSSVKSFLDFTSSDEYRIPEKYSTADPCPRGPMHIESGDLEALATFAALWMVKKNPKEKVPLQDWTQAEVDEILRAIFNGAIDAQWCNDQWRRDRNVPAAVLSHKIARSPLVPVGVLKAGGNCTKETQEHTKKRKRKGEQWMPCKWGAKGQKAALQLTETAKWRFKCNSGHPVQAKIVEEGDAAAMTAIKDRLKVRLWEERLRVTEANNTPRLLVNMRMILYLRSNPEKRDKLSPYETPPTTDLDELYALLHEPQPV